MTTRRGFIQGVLAALGAAVVPKVAAATPVKVADVAPGMGALNASARKAADAITEMAETFAAGFVPLDNFSRVAVYYNGGCTEYHLDVTDYANVKWTLVGADHEWPDDIEWVTVQG